LQTTILSRFDLIFIVRDERLYERDLRIADHVLAIHAGAGDDGDDKTNPEREREQKFLKRYVEYCRAMCSPRLVPKSAKLLEDQYVRYRQEMRERAKKGGAPRGADHGAATGSHHAGFRITGEDVFTEQGFGRARSRSVAAV
jgi:DNA replication licensing factor MCM5